MTTVANQMDEAEEAAQAVALNERLSDALGAHDVHPELRNKITDAYQEAGGVQYATWGDLPADIQQLIEEIEKYPRTSWDDPADVPDDLPE